jgi:hypothetical protein
VQAHISRFFVRASPIGFATGMHELQFAFSLADIKGGQPFPDFYDFISPTSDFAGLVCI